MFQFVFILFSLVAGAEQERVVGSIASIQAGSGEFMIRTDAGKTLAARLLENANVLRVQPGEKDMSKAAKVTLNEVTAGDRVIARGAVSEEAGGYILVSTLVVMSRGAITEEQARQQLEWKTKSLRGVVQSVDAGQRQVRFTARAMDKQREWTMTVPEKADIKRYDDDSVRYADARGATLDALKPGNQIRVLGAKDEAAGSVTAEQILFGTFRTIGGEIVAVRPAQGEVVINDVQTKKKVTVKVPTGANLRRMPTFGGGMMGGGMMGGGPPGGMMRMGGGAGDLQQMIERMPAAVLEDFKQGDAIIASVTATSKLITMVAGVDFLLRAPAAQVNRVLGNWSTEVGMPGQ